MQKPLHFRHGWKQPTVPTMYVSQKKGAREGHGRNPGHSVSCNHPGIAPSAPDRPTRGSKPTSLRKTHCSNPKRKASEQALMRAPGMQSKAAARQHPLPGLRPRACSQPLQPPTGSSDKREHSSKVKRRHAELQWVPPLCCHSLQPGVL